jgi:hypothetical protein
MGDFDIFPACVQGFKVEARPLRKGEEVKQLESKEETEEERAQRERNEAALKALLNDVAWKKVCDSKTGLHSKVSLQDLGKEKRRCSVSLHSGKGASFTAFLEERGRASKCC